MEMFIVLIVEDQVDWAGLSRSAGAAQIIIKKIGVDHFVQWIEVLWGPRDLGTIHHGHNCYLTLAAIARQFCICISVFVVPLLTLRLISLHYNLADYKFLVRYKIYKSNYRLGTSEDDPFYS